MDDLKRRKTTFSKLEKIQAHLLKGLEIRLVRLKKRQAEVRHNVNLLRQEIEKESIIHSQYSTSLPALEGFIKAQEKKREALMQQQKDLEVLETKLQEVIRLTRIEEEKYNLLTLKQFEMIRARELKLEQARLDDLGQRRKVDF